MAIREVVKDQNLMAGLDKQPAGHAADIAGTAGNQNAHQGNISRAFFVGKPGASDHARFFP